MTAVNIAIMAAISHMCIWHWSDIKTAGQVVDIRKMFKKDFNWRFWQHKASKVSDEEADKIDPHYRLMQAYDDVPSWWFGLLWVAAVVVGFITSRVAHSTLDWVSFFYVFLKIIRY